MQFNPTHVLLNGFAILSKPFQQTVLKEREKFQARVLGQVFIERPQCGSRGQLLARLACALHSLLRLDAAKKGAASFFKVL